jgi:hypothetical protein
MSVSASHGYNTDFVLWARDQAVRLREGRLEELDVENLAEELDALARAESFELFRRVARLMEYLFQWAHWPDARVPAWYMAVVEERDMIKRFLEDSPSLADEWADLYARAWGKARLGVLSATNVADVFVPEQCPWEKEQLLSLAFWPGGGEVP